MTKAVEGSRQPVAELQHDSKALRSETAVHCIQNRAGLEYFRTVYERYRSNLNPRFTANFRPARAFSCRYVHYLAGVMRERAREARERYADEWNWRSWMPAVWVRLGICESGKNPPNWAHDSGSYQGAFGFAVSTWDQFRLAGYPRDAFLASPRQQLEVALVLYRRYGGSPWGCWGR